MKNLFKKFLILAVAMCAFTSTVIPAEACTSCSSSLVNVSAKKKIKKQTPTLAKKTVTIYVGQKYRIKPVTTGKLVCTSNNKKVATVAKSTGWVTAKKIGKATIKVVCKSNKTYKAKTFKVTVKVVAKPKVTPKPTPQPTPTPTPTPAPVTEKDKLLANITEDWKYYTFYTPDQTDTAVGVLKNNNDRDLSLVLHINYYDADGYWKGVTFHEYSYFKSGEEIIILDKNAMSQYVDMEYSLKETPLNVSDRRKNESLVTTEDKYGIVTYEYKNPDEERCQLEAWIVYYDQNNKIIGFDESYVGGILPLSDSFELPVNEQLKTVNYSSYKVFVNPEY